jgi:uncharacterized protein
MTAVSISISSKRMTERDFIPHPALQNPHLMTLFPQVWPRRRLLRRFPSEPRLFAVGAESRILGHCHWQRRSPRAPLLLLLHGLEGCSESHYMLGVADKAWKAGFHVIRLNQRNCGGTDHLTPTLYHSGLGGDLLAVMSELGTRDGIDSVWLAGYSMGGNIVLRLAGELGLSLPSLKGIVAVSPTIEPTACVEALAQKGNRLYQKYFLARLRTRLRRKARLFPGRYDLSRLHRIRTLREFDECYTAPDGGYVSAADYYERTGAQGVIGSIRLPTLIIAAQDDPIVPRRLFENPALRTNPCVRLLFPRHGGHCGFIQRSWPGEDRFWAENRAIEFIARCVQPNREVAGWS